MLEGIKCQQWAREATFTVIHLQTLAGARDLTASISFSGVI